MRVRDAVMLLAGSDLAELGPTTWADLGCGEGTFTRALAEVLAPGSVIHAMDRDAVALRAIPSRRQGIQIHTHQGDFTRADWPFDGLDGILLANSLHYVEDQPAFIAACAARMIAPRFLIVEYDTNEANPWVPFPVSRARLSNLFQEDRRGSVRWLGQRPSVYRRAAIYAALARMARGCAK